jgi:hypothetical protein
MKLVIAAATREVILQALIKESTRQARDLVAGRWEQAIRITINLLKHKFYL